MRPIQVPMRRVRRSAPCDPKCRRSQKCGFATSSVSLEIESELHGYRTRLHPTAPHSTYVCDHSATSAVRTAAPVGVTSS